MVFAASLVLIGVATLMFLGWGGAFLRLLRIAPKNWPTTVALGMAAVVFIGGILNLARLAYPIPLAIVAGIGVILAILRLRGLDRPPLIVAIIILIVLFFTIGTQLPPSIYNFHDDYQKYFAYPVRMIETGTVFGSPLSAMGLQTLGGQAFLDGFVVAFFPMIYINGVDAVFGLFLCLLLASEVTKNRLMTIVCVLSVVFINPQYVNISTLYCGSALIMAMAAVEDSAALGLLYAALIAMKPIYGVFIAIHLLTMVSANSIRWAVRTGLTAAVFLLPWALIHAPNYLAALRLHRSAPTPVAGDIDSEPLNLFSFGQLPYGSTAANYTALAFAFAICGVICWRSKSLKTVACCVTAVATLLVFVYVFGPIEYGYEHGLRYFIPVAIGLAPAIFGATNHRLRWLPLAVAIVPLAAFGPSLVSRVATEFTTHSAASYAWLTKDPEYIEYNQRVLQGPERQHVKALQERVPAGEPTLTWTTTPFYFDYRRNRIIDIDTAGIGVPWAALPPARYLIWDYAGFATEEEEVYEKTALNAGAGERRDSMRTLDFIRCLRGMVEKGEVLYDDGEVEVVRIK